MNIWYLDDGHLVGPIAALSQALQVIVQEGQRLGVAVNPSKCKLWGPGVSLTELAPELPPEMAMDVDAPQEWTAIPVVPWEQGRG